MRIAILTDSSCSPHLVQAPNLFTIPLLIDDLQTAQHYLDNFLKSEVFVAKLKAGLVRSQPSTLAMLIEKLDTLFLTYEHVIYCGVYSGLSDQLNLVRMLANNYYRDRLTVIDSFGTSVMLDRALEGIIQVLQTDSSPANIQAQLEANASRYDSYVVLNNPSPMLQTPWMNHNGLVLAHGLHMSLVLHGAQRTLVPLKRHSNYRYAVQFVLRELKTKIPNLKSVDCAFGLVHPKVRRKVLHLIRRAKLKVGLVGSLSQSLMCHIGADSLIICGWG